jgi:Protein of unknown function (DUF3592)
MQQLIPLLLMPLGIVFLYFGIKGIFRTRDFLKHAIETDGSVVEIEEDVSTDSDGYTTRYYYPIINYRVGKNNAFTFKSKIGRGDRRAFREGQILKILYDSRQHNEAEVKSSVGIWSGTYVLVVIGALLIITSTFLILNNLGGR